MSLLITIGENYLREYMGKKIKSRISFHFFPCQRDELKDGIHFIEPFMSTIRHKKNLHSAISWTGIFFAAPTANAQ